MANPPLSPTEFNSAVTAITSAFGDPTRREIYLFTRERAAGVTTGDVARQFDLHPNVARHHLDKLAGGGYVEVGPGQAEGAGRPSKRYSVTEATTAVEVPIRHDDVLIRLLGRALARLPAEEAEALAEDVGIEYGRTMAHALGGDDAQRSFRSALHAVADALTAHGFAAHTDKRSGQLQIVQEHCPFGEAVIEHPVICAVDRGMVRGMLAALYGHADTTTSSSKPMGDEVCVTEVTG
ncbi:MAG: helix-turn-helix domain-containing protein [Acidimicrobiia bacterium]|nr:helix-turn-helix domain-containing protein [Acidimicrobiia bacterium]